MRLRTLNRKGIRTTENGVLEDGRKG